MHTHTHTHTYTHTHNPPTHIRTHTVTHTYTHTHTQSLKQETYTWGVFHKDFSFVIVTNLRMTKIICHQPRIVISDKVPFHKANDSLPSEKCISIVVNEPITNLCCFSAVSSTAVNLCNGSDCDRKFPRLRHKYEIIVI